jgi:hypothetical protein
VGTVGSVNQVQPGVDVSAPANLITVLAPHQATSALIHDWSQKYVLVQTHYIFLSQENSPATRLIDLQYSHQGSTFFGLISALPNASDSNFETNIASQAPDVAGSEVQATQDKADASFANGRAVLPEQYPTDFGSYVARWFSTSSTQAQSNN